MTLGRHEFRIHIHELALRDTYIPKTVSVCNKMALIWQEKGFASDVLFEVILA